MSLADRVRSAAVRCAARCAVSVPLACGSAAGCATPPSLTPPSPTTHSPISPSPTTPSATPDSPSAPPPVRLPLSLPAHPMSSEEEEHMRDAFFRAASYLETNILHSLTYYRADFDFTVNNQAVSGHYLVFRRPSPPRRTDAAAGSAESHGISDQVIDFSVEYGAGTPLFERRQYVYGAHAPYPLFSASKTTLAQNWTARREGSNWSLHITGLWPLSSSVSLLSESAAEKIKRGFRDDLTLFVDIYARNKGIYAEACSEARRERPLL